MISRIKDLLNPKPPTRRTVTLLSAVAIGGRHYEPGASVTIPEKEADSLIADGTASDPQGQAAAGEKLAALAAKLPAPRPVQPIPDYWKSLPDCFATWWNLNEAAVGLIWRRDEIQRHIVKLLTRNTMGAKMNHDLKSSLGNIPAGASKDILIAGVAAAIEVGKRDPDYLAEIRYFEDAYYRAAAAVDDFREKHGDKYTVAKLECGDFLQAEHLKTCESIAEAKGIARELFSTRIADLGLAEREVSRLFSGSADYLKVSQFQPPTLEDLRVAWSEGDGRTKLFVDRSPATMADILQSWEKLREAADATKKQINQELSRSQKVRKAAA